MHEEEKIERGIDLSAYQKKAISFLNHVPQTGPNCGLAALAMVAKLTPVKNTLEQIFIEAKSRNYTVNGEMFSVAHMAELARSFLSPWFTVEEYSGGLAAHRSLVTESLFNWSLVLIPYDAGKNHGPVCMKGHKAHWAVLCGMLVDSDGEESVVASHGKSRYLGVWSLEALSSSNENLIEFSPTRAADGLSYVLPEGGLQAGLANQFILLKKENGFRKDIQFDFSN